jgi:small-conductance mechanosensitive channel
MPNISDIREPIDLAMSLAPFFATLAFYWLFIWGIYKLLIGRHNHLGSEKLFSRQLIIMGLGLISIIGVILALPVSESSRNQIIGLVGLVISGVLALSSSTVFANLMAGILLRVTKPFKIGDFIRVQDYFGRVCERGLFDTEIQSESRELIAIPNTYLISNPITTVNSTGAIVSASLSLGYDIHHMQLENLLNEAAEKCELTDSFVHITELGDYSITYRVSGVLAEVKGLITARSKLYRSVLDVLHGEGIEVMSPSYMNQRKMDEIKKVLPRPLKAKLTETSSSAEDIVFDKAEKALQTDAERKILLSNLEQLAALLKEAKDEEKEGINSFISAVEARLKVIDTPLSEQVKEAETEQAQPNAEAEPDTKAK